MRVNGPQIEMYSNESQFWKAAAPIKPTEAGILIPVSEQQCWKVASEIIVNDSPSVIFFRRLQPEKAWLPMNSTDSGTATLSNDSQSTKAPGPIIVKDSGRVMRVKFWHRLNASS